MEENVLVIWGNGFDIDLGWKTSFTDVCRSRVFIDGMRHFQYDYLSELQDKNYWCDLELYLRDMLIKSHFATGWEPLEFWVMTFWKIYEYLYPSKASPNTYCTDKTSCAYRFLNRISNAKIISFNYTSPFKMIGLKEREIVHIHGDLEDANSIKLGVDKSIIDYVNNVEEYSKILKTYNNDNVERFISAIKNSSTIIVYGHSLGITDSDYFKPMFDMLINNKEPKKLFFITKNGNSLQQMKKNLQSYSIDFNKMLCSNNSIEIIYTKENITLPKFNELLTLI